MLKFPLDRYKNQEMCDKVDDSLPILKFVPDWFVTNEIMKKLQNALFRDDDILLLDKDPCNVTFSSNWNNINPDDAYFYEDDPNYQLFMIDVWLGTINLNNANHLKKK